MRHSCYGCCVGSAKCWKRCILDDPPNSVSNYFLQSELEEQLTKAKEESGVLKAHLEELESEAALAQTLSEAALVRLLWK